jgi:hypothetical protein
MDLVRVSRGLATGDLDGDGDLDVVILDANDAAEVWRNDRTSNGGSLLVDLLNAHGSYAVGGFVRAEITGKSQLREVRTASSYLSQNAMSCHFGVGAAVRVDRLSVRWPDGHSQEIREVPVGARVRIMAGG